MVGALKCKQCGGNIVPEGTEYGTCDSCGVKSALPKISDEKKLNLLNRANELRQRGEYDKAIFSYENLIKEDDTDPEVFFSLALTKHGIEYVLDPKSNNRVPVCHRLSYSLLTNDNDYLKALELSTEYNRSLYESQGKEIAKIQTKILQISRNETPYDIFICYKESDSGRRTNDSEYAYDIYRKLTSLKYKVFFARVSLTAGVEYEPAIFAALNSTKIMILIGTKTEYLESVWVKNEWSRFLKLMSQDTKKTMITCYKNIDAYSLPPELQPFQSLELGTFESNQKLIESIQRVITTTKDDNASMNTDITHSSFSKDADKLNAKILGLLRLDDFKKATINSAKMTDEYPGDPRGWANTIRSVTENLTYLILPNSEEENDIEIYEFLMDKFNRLNKLTNNGYDDIKLYFERCQKEEERLFNEEAEQTKQYELTKETLFSEVEAKKQELELENGQKVVVYYENIKKEKEIISALKNDIFEFKKILNQDYEEKDSLRNKPTTIIKIIFGASMALIITSIILAFSISPLYYPVVWVLFAIGFICIPVEIILHKIFTHNLAKPILSRIKLNNELLQNKMGLLGKSESIVKEEERKIQMINDKMNNELKNLSIIYKGKFDSITVPNKIESNTINIKKNIHIYKTANH